MARAKLTQKVLRFGANADGRGGAREGAGRPRTGTAGVSHLARCEHKGRHPIHVTLKLAQGLPRLRNKATRPVIEAAFQRGKNRFGFRLNHYSIQGDHLHLIVEAKDRTALSRGMKGLAVRLARRLNSLWQRRGQVFPERYHEHILRTPREVRNALAYVLKNVHKHAKSASMLLDAYASCAWFDGWRRDDLELGSVLARSNDHAFAEAESHHDPPVTRARTWLLKTGWRRCGLIPIVAR